MGGQVGYLLCIVVGLGIGFFQSSIAAHLPIKETQKEK